MEKVLNQGTETKRKGIIGGGRALQTLSSKQSAYERWNARISSEIHPHAMRGGAGKRWHCRIGMWKRIARKSSHEELVADVGGDEG